MSSLFCLVYIIEYSLCLGTEASSFQKESPWGHSHFLIPYSSDYLGILSERQNIQKEQNRRFTG